jgi:hypothetical protein
MLFNFDKSRLHLIPVLITDLGEQALAGRPGYQTDAQLARLQAIRDYCNEVINKYQAKKIA